MFITSKGGESEKSVTAIQLLVPPRTQFFPSRDSAGPPTQISSTSRNRWIENQIVKFASPPHVFEAIWFPLFNFRQIPTQLNITQSDCNGSLVNGVLSRIVSCVSLLSPGRHCSNVRTTNHIACNRANKINKCLQINRSVPSFLQQWQSSYTNRNF